MGPRAIRVAVPGVVFGTLLAVVLLGGPSPANSAGQRGHSPPVYGLPSEAGYLSEDPSTRASTVLTVPRIDCSAVAPGSAAGQSYGITFSGNIHTRRTSGPHPWMAAVVRTVCNGSRARYQAYFIRAGSVSSAGAAEASPVATEVYSSAPVTVRPGQRIALRASATAARSTMSIENLDTREHASVRGAGVPDAGTSLRVSTVTADRRGRVFRGGTLPQSSKPATVPGPVAAGPALFARSRIDGKPFLKAPGLAVELWVTARRSGGGKKSTRILALPIATQRPRGGIAIVIAAASVR